MAAVSPGPVLLKLVVPAVDDEPEADFAAFVPLLPTLLDTAPLDVDLVVFLELVVLLFVVLEPLFEFGTGAVSCWLVAVVFELLLPLATHE